MGNCASDKYDTKVAVEAVDRKEESNDKKRNSFKKTTVVDGGKVNPYLDTSQFTRFAEKYKLDSEVLGQGGFAVVQLASTKAGGNKVAVKIVNRSGEDSVVAELALHKENDVLKNLDHPHIVRALDFFENDKQLRFVIEYLDGGELFNRIVFKSYYNEKEARDLCRVLLGGIKYLHDKDVVHRDLKPENLLMTSPLDEADLKLVDFGFASVLAPGEQLTDPFGTVGYCAPEVIRQQPHGKPVDMWAFGVLLFLLLSGVHPFDNGETERIVNTRSANAEWTFTPEYWAAVGEDAKDLVAKLLVKDPAKRFTADEALGHPWMHTEGEGGDLIGAKENLKKYLALKRLKAGVHAITASLKMSKSAKSMRGKSFSENSHQSGDSLSPEMAAAQSATLLAYDLSNEIVDLSDGGPAEV